MRTHSPIIALLSAVLLCAFSQQFAAAAPLQIVIMQDKAGDADKYAPLVDYLEERGLETKLVAAADYNEAAQMFAAGKADAMFSGSGVAGTLIIKQLARPLVRPVSKEGWSTYWAVIIGRKRAPKFSGSPEYFRGKRIVYCALASSGEFYYSSVTRRAPKLDTTVRLAKTHHAALGLLALGGADIAIVKNRVWDRAKENLPMLEKVGEDRGENPNGTLMVSGSLPGETVAQLKSTLLGLGSDESASAKEVKASLGIQGYIETTQGDFDHTLKLLKKAGVSSTFHF